MTIVVDASAVVASLADAGPDGEWVRAAMKADVLIAPCHVYVEVSSVLRRAVLADAIGKDVAALAHRGLVELSIKKFDFEPLASRVWELHPNITPYDAAYVALAEAFGVSLLTLDRRLSRAAGPTCTFVTPPIS